MNIERLVLFIYELSILGDIEYLNSDREYQMEYEFNEEIINPIFVEFLNQFIVDIFPKDKELLSTIFDISKLEECIQTKQNILDFRTLKEILKKFRGQKKYLELIESIDKEIDNKLNILALNFIDYYNENVILLLSKHNVYQRILQ